MKRDKNMYSEAVAIAIKGLKQSVNEYDARCEGCGNGLEYTSRYTGANGGYEIKVIIKEI